MAPVNSIKHIQKKPRLRDTTESSLIAFYDIWLENGTQSYKASDVGMHIGHHSMGVMTL